MGRVMKTVNDIRSEFINYFVKQGHEHVASSPLVPQNDPTLMFANSGMVQFKNVFTGAEKRPYSRATTAQKSVRAGGKHNDLDNVGYTARHATFFEMLGNFSFGDYFKDDAIAFAWELVTKNFGMKKDKLLVTVHYTDDQAANIWKKVTGFSDDKIIRIHDKEGGKNDNFWMMGDFGPCGPCSEIFIDRGEHIFGGPPGSKDEDGDRFLEFWNLVFMQYEQEPDGNSGYSRVPLPKPSIDTGMGLERMATILQGVNTIFDIDLMRSIIEHSADLTGVSPDGDQAPSHRVIADHLRCSAFLLADGVMPSNEGRGYVLRRIMRRGMRHAHLLGAQEPLLYKLFPTLMSMMGEAYPELIRAQALITETLKNEETRFKKTLDRGLKMLDEESEKLGKGQSLSGDVAFKLYDTYGFPVDLTADALRAKGLDVDMAGFETAMEKQKETARKSWAGSGDAGTSKIWFDVLDKFGATEFLGYSQTAAEGKILGIIKRSPPNPPASGGEARSAGGEMLEAVDSLQSGEEGFIIVNQTPFYAESGGQTGDTGAMLTAQGDSFEVTDTKKQLGKLWVHVGKVTKGKISVGEGVELRVDTRRRAAIQSNHSVTHLLHEALRLTLGDHIAQKGSLQDESRTRFDVSQPNPISAVELRKIEDDVNAQIRANTEVVTRVLPLEEAMQSGARALFGEKYDDEVRVVSMGTLVPYTPSLQGGGRGEGPHPNPLPEGRGNMRPYSVELCGGTHVKRTGEIGIFKIVSESAVSAGIRRIEALTGENALRYFEEQEGRVNEIASMLKASPAEVTARVKSLADENKKMKNEISNLKRLSVSDIASGKFSNNRKFEDAVLGKGKVNEDISNEGLKEIAGIKFISRILKDFPAKELKPIADDMKKKLGSGVVVLIATEEDKASIVVAVTSDLTDRISAVDLVKAGAAALGGSGGGGRPDMAQAGGPNAAAANDAATAISRALAG
jgi:alanyl-tRNA synthetase